MSRRQIFFLLSFLYTLLVVLSPNNLAGGLAVFAAACLVVNLVLADLLWTERVIFPIYLGLLGMGALSLKLILSLRLVLGLKTALLFLVLWLLSYLTVLSLNILNVATVRTVPLRKVALSFIYYLGVILGVPLYFLILAVFYYNFVLLFGLSFGLSLLLALPNFYFSQVEGVLGETFGAEFRVRPRFYWAELVVLGFVMGQSALMLVFWPAAMFVKAVFLSGTLFVLVSFFQNVILKKISQRSVREFLVVWAGLFLMLMLSRQ